jgi:hypothetical protein
MGAFLGERGCGEGLLTVTLDKGHYFDFGLTFALPFTFHSMKASSMRESERE